MESPTKENRDAVHYVMGQLLKKHCYLLLTIDIVVGIVYACHLHDICVNKLDKCQMKGLSTAFYLSTISDR